MCDSAELLKKVTLISDELLPNKSRHQYEAAFEQFMRWRSANNVETFSENVFWYILKNYLKSLYFLNTYVFSAQGNFKD